MVDIPIRDLELSTYSPFEPRSSRNRRSDIRHRANQEIINATEHNAVNKALDSQINNKQPHGASAVNDDPSVIRPAPCSPRSANWIGSLKRYEQTSAELERHNVEEENRYRESQHENFTKQTVDGITEEQWIAQAAPLVYPEAYISGLPDNEHIFRAMTPAEAREASREIARRLYFVYRANT